MHTKKLLITLIGIIAVLVVVVGLSRNKAPNLSEQESDTTLNTPTAEPRVVKTESTVIAKEFPEGFPVEVTAQGSEGYTYIPANSVEQQSTLEFTSQKSVEENGKIYFDFINISGFKIVNSVEKKDLVFFYATKDENDLSITIKQGIGGTIVSVSYLKR